MKEIQVTFTGRFVGSIGKTNHCTVYVVAPKGLTAENATGTDLELIYAQLYKSHEHISNIKIKF